MGSGAADRLAHMIRRMLAVAAIGAGLAVALTGCTKPTPGATVTSGAQSVHQQALCWSFDDAGLDAGSCASDVIDKAVAAGKVPTLPVVAGNTIGISVDPVVAEAGWIPQIDGQPIVEEPITETYYRFTYPSLTAVPSEGLLLDIKAASGDETRGFWVFALVPSGE